MTAWRHLLVVGDGSVPVVGRCGECGTETNELPCLRCEVEDPTEDES